MKMMVAAVMVWFISPVSTRPFAKTKKGRGGARLCGVPQDGSEGLHAGVKWYVEAEEGVEVWNGAESHSGGEVKRAI